MRWRSRAAGLLTVSIVSGVALFISHLHLVKQHQALRRQHAALVDERRGAVVDLPRARDFSVPPKQALELLREGNLRYITEETSQVSSGLSLQALRVSLARQGQKPFAIVIGCADSRCPVEEIFDAGPGDIFVLRNTGNSCTNPEGSLVAGVEYATGVLEARLLLVLGHTGCGAMTGATHMMLARLAGDEVATDLPTALDAHLEDLSPAAYEAKRQLPSHSSVEQIAALAIRLNVFNTMQKLVEYSAPLREKVASGEVEVHGAIYHLVSGEVEVLGQHPQLQAILNSTRFPDE